MDLDRFIHHEPNTGCWLWVGTCNKKGYGVYRQNRETSKTMAHRIVFESERGPIPAGLHLDHLCRVRCCVNPSHLEAVTPAVNNARSLSPTAMNARKTHCKRGHEFPPGKNRPGGRGCKVCHCIRTRLARQKKRTAKARGAA